MQPTKITWISFLVAISALAIPNKTMAQENTSFSEQKSQPIESRLTKIAKTLQQKEKDFNELSTQDDIKKPFQIAGGWVKGRGSGGFANRSGGGGFANRSGGGGFVNHSGGGGFVNRSGGWRDGGGFLNRRY